MLNFEKESLLCDEVLFDTSPKIEYGEEDNMQVANGYSHDQSEEEIAQAFAVILKKEVSYMPCSGYVDRLNSDPFIRKERKKAMWWLIKSQRRLGFSLETLFNAANYLDRFISNSKCHGWYSWMFELLSIASLSVAGKFNETSNPQFQGNYLGHYFEWELIQRMEFTLLKAIEWRLRPTTPFSYVEILTWNLPSINSYFSKEFINRLTQLLLNALLDYAYLEFRPFSIAMSVIKFASEELPFENCNADGLQHFHLFGDAQDYLVKEDILKCQEMMRKKQPIIIDDRSLLHYYCYCNNTNGGDGGTGGSGHSSPVTVLSMAVDDHLTTCFCGGGKSKSDASDHIIKTTTQVISYRLTPRKRMKKQIAT